MFHLLCRRTFTPNHHCAHPTSAEQARGGRLLLEKGIVKREEIKPFYQHKQDVRFFFNTTKEGFVHPDDPSPTDTFSIIVFATPLYRLH